MAVNVYVNLGSIYALWWLYWMGARDFNRSWFIWQAMLSLNQVRPFLTADPEAPAQGRAVDDWPHHLGQRLCAHGLTTQSFTLGTANMPIQYGQARSQIAVLLKDHPQFSARFADILDETMTVLYKCNQRLWCAEGFTALCGHDGHSRRPTCSGSCRSAVTPMCSPRPVASTIA